MIIGWCYNRVCSSLNTYCSLAYNSAPTSILRQCLLLSTCQVCKPLCECLSKWIYNRHSNRSRT